MRTKRDSVTLSQTSFQKSTAVNYKAVQLLLVSAAAGPPAEVALEIQCNCTLTWKPTEILLKIL